MCVFYNKNMYEEHQIKCSSCGNTFLSKTADTLCNECFKSTSNRLKPFKKTNQY